MANSGPKLASHRRLRIAFTPGEPAGIGPDLAIQLAQQARDVEIVAFADPDLLLERARKLRLPLEISPWREEAATAARAPGQLAVFPVRLKVPAHSGQLDRRNAGYVLATLREAVAACLEGVFSALVTGPVHKGIINDAGIPFSGHTEYLAELSGGSQPVMMLATPGLRVALATTHLPLAAVSKAISGPLLERVLQVLNRDLQHRFSIPHPRILVCGLNPHAGEGGHLGREEQEIIEPTLARLRKLGMNLLGPLPADTAFTPPRLALADAVLAMYHDQGLPVLKHLGFGRSVNLTLGLPLIRASVDHGTALDLAGSGRAELGSLQYALETASALARAEAASSHANDIADSVEA